MNDNDPLISEYYRLNPTLFTVVGSVTIAQDISTSGVCEQSLSIVLSKELGGGSPNLYLTFYSVRKLVFQQPDWSQISIGPLEILAGSEIPSVNSKYLVRDPEQERILWFECNYFEAVLG